MRKTSHKQVTAWISDYSRPYFTVSGLLRNSKAGGYCIDLGEDGNYVFPLAHRKIEVYAGEQSLHKYFGMKRIEA